MKPSSNKTSRCRMGGLLLCLVLLWLGSGIEPAGAHSGGKFELYIPRIEVIDDGNGSATVDAYVIDKDSGDPALGFAVTAMGTDANGKQIAPVELANKGTGHYVGTVALTPGQWKIRVDAKQGFSGASAIPTSKTVGVSIRGGEPVPAGGTSGGPAPGAETSPDSGKYGIEVLLTAPEDILAAPPSRNYITVTVRVTDQATGVGIEPEQEVNVTPTNEIGDVVEGYPLAYPYKDHTGPAGEYKGWVIVPHGGAWTLVASVIDSKTQNRLGVGRLDVNLDVPTLDSYEGPGGVGGDLAAQGSSVQKFGSILLLWSHTMFALLWGLTVAAFAALALPSLRSALSNRALNFFESHMTGMVRLALWSTAFLIGTGVVNLIQETVYTVPTSPDKATRLFQLPYAKPYMLALAIKLAAYTVMALASIPLILAARRRTSVFDGSTPSGVSLGVRPTPSPGQSVSLGLPGGGLGAQVLEREAPARVEVSAAPLVGQRRGVRLSVAVLLGGGAVLTIALTALKYFHVVAEGLRG